MKLMIKLKENKLSKKILFLRIMDIVIYMALPTYLPGIRYQM